MPMFSIPLSGLSSASDALSVISNNLANLNTPAYKGQNVSFRDMFYQALGTSGNGNPLQVGGGAAISSITSNFSDGNTSATGVGTDVAIQGNGFFVTDDNGVMRFTRDGHFGTNDDGQLITESGQLVLGYRATNGVIPANQTLSSISLNRGLTTPALPTSLVHMNVNLNAGTATGATFSTPITVYDSLGNDHVLTFSFTKTSANNWDYSVTMPSSDFQGTPSYSSTVSYAKDDIVASGATKYISLTGTNVGNAVSDTANWAPITNWTAPSGGPPPTPNYAVGNVVEYNGSYYRAAVASTTARPTDPGTDWTAISASELKLKTGSLVFNGRGELVNPTQNVNGIGLPNGVSFLDGADPAFNFNWQLLDSNDKPMLTQSAAASGQSQPYQNGYRSGTLTDYAVNSDGMVQAKFSNGQTMAVAQLALATFANTQGLERAGGNSFNSTLASGAAGIGIPGSGGRGKLAGSSLELSNVDMSKEFSNLIVTQRAFQANARVITTFDQVTQETINLKQG